MRFSFAIWAAVLAGLLGLGVIRGAPGSWPEGSDPVTPVSVAEAATVRGGDSGDPACKTWSYDFVDCGNKLCSGQTKKCPTLVYLTAEGNFPTSVSVKNEHRVENATCAVCGGACSKSGQHPAYSFDECAKK